MKKINLSKTFRSFAITIKKRSPAILTGIGVAGMALTTVTAVKVTPKALKLIDERKEELEVDKLSIRETIKTTYKCYIPSAVTGILSAGCIIFASSVSGKRNAALATAYHLSETAFKDYKDSVVKTIGKDKESEITDDVAKKQIERTPFTSKEVVFTDREGELCLEPISGRYFRARVVDIEKAVNELNKELINEMYASLNDFYYEIGLDGTKMGDVLGWNIDKGTLEITFYYDCDPDDKPCRVLKYSVNPSYDYDHVL